MTVPPEGGRRQTRRRLVNYDYASSGAYFITICAWQRKSFFKKSEVRNVIDETWREIPSHFPAVLPDVYVVMPNHFHAILMLNAPAVGSQHAGSLRSGHAEVQAASVSTIVRSFKSTATNRLRDRGLVEGAVWQSNFFDRVIRNEAELNRVREYIALNPLRWHFDHDNPNRVLNEEYERAWSWLETGS